MTVAEITEMESAVSQEFLRIVTFISDFKANLYGTAKLNVKIKKTHPFSIEIYVGNFIGFNTPSRQSPFCFYRSNTQACKALKNKVENMLKEQKFQVRFEDPVEDTITYAKVFKGK